MKYEEIKVVKQAIISEIEGHEFYKLAAKDAPTEDTKAAFLEIAEEELKHIGWLKSLYFSLMTEKYDLNKLADIEDPHLPNFFKWENLDRSGAAKAISVFGIGMQMERAAVEFYRKAGEDTKIPEAKNLYNKLVVWEQVHMEQFLKQYEKLLEEWWNDQEFAPF